MHFLLVNLERVLAAIITGKLAGWRLRWRAEGDHATISDGAGTDRASILENKNLLNKMLSNGEKIARKQTKLIAAEYAHKPFLAREDLSESEIFMIEKLKGQNENLSLATIPEVRD